MSDYDGSVEMAVAPLPPLEDLSNVSEKFPIPMESRYYGPPWLQKVAESRLFSNWFLFLIFFNLIFTAATVSNRTDATNLVGVIVTGLYALAFIPRAFMKNTWKDVWTIFSAVLLISAIISDIIRLGDGQYWLVFYCFFLLRPMRTLAKFKMLRQAINAVFASLDVVLNFVLTMLIFIFPTAIFLTQAIGNNVGLSDLATDEGTFNKQLWGNMWKSMLSLFQIATLDWGDIVRASVMAEPWLALIFITFIVVSGFAVSNVFITIIGESYSSQTTDDVDYTAIERKEEFLKSFSQECSEDADVDVLTACPTDVQLSNADIACMLISLKKMVLQKRKKD